MVFIHPVGECVVLLVMAAGGGKSGADECHEMAVALRHAYTASVEFFLDDNRVMLVAAFFCEDSRLVLRESFVGGPSTGTWQMRNAAVGAVAKGFSGFGFEGSSIISKLAAPLPKAKFPYSRGLTTFKPDLRAKAA